jgi:hypothetical protein
MKHSRLSPILSRLTPPLFVAALFLRLLACGGSVSTGTGGQGGAGDGLPDPPEQTCKATDDCMWPASVCADKTTEVDFVMPTCGSDGLCHWVKQTVACSAGDECANGACPFITDTAGGT